MLAGSLDWRTKTVPNGKVCVAIVTYNSGRYIRRCLESVLRQKGVPLEVIVLDNASTDDTREILEDFDGRVRTIRSETNLGFAEGQNRAIRSSDSDWVLTLNPDVLLLPGFIRKLLEAGQSDPGAGAVCGKLLSIGPGSSRWASGASIPRACTSRRPCGISTAAGTNRTTILSTAPSTFSARPRRPRFTGAR